MSEEYAKKAADVASKGRYGDSMILHVNPLEVAAIDKMYPGMITRNPDTGQPEAFLFLLPLLGFLGKVGGAIGGGLAGAAAKVGTAFGLGATPAATLAPGAGVLAPGATTAMSGLGALAPGAGVLAPGAASAAGAGGSAAAGLAGAAGSAGSSALSSLGGLAPGGGVLQGGGLSSTASGLMTGGQSGALMPGAGVLAPGSGGGMTVGKAASALKMSPAELVAKVKSGSITPDVTNQVAEMVRSGSMPTGQETQFAASFDPTKMSDVTTLADRTMMQSAFREPVGTFAESAVQGSPQASAAKAAAAKGGIGETFKSAGNVLKEAVLDPIGGGIKKIGTAAKNNPIPSLLVGYGAIDAIANAAAGDGRPEYEQTVFDADFDYTPTRRAMSNLNRPRHSYADIRRIG
jgi:hypothetical protein